MSILVEAAEGRISLWVRGRELRLSREEARRLKGFLAQVLGETGAGYAGIIPSNNPSQPDDFPECLGN